MKLGTLSIASVGVALLGGCMSAAVPAQRVASSEAAIRAAQEVGAAQNPGAALHLRLAEDQLNAAKRLIGDGENTRADWVLMRAQSDAELSLALAKEQTAKAQAQQALDRIHTLQGQTQPAASSQSSMATTQKGAS